MPWVCSSGPSSTIGPAPSVLSSGTPPPASSGSSAPAATPPPPQQKPESTQPQPEKPNGPLVQTQDPDSVISVQLISFGSSNNSGGSTSDDEEEEKKRRKKEQEEAADGNETQGAQ